MKIKAERITRMLAPLLGVAGARQFMRSKLGFGVREAKLKKERNRKRNRIARRSRRENRR